MMDLILLGLLFLLGYLLVRPCVRPSNFPPGPLQLPIVGFIPHFVAAYGADMLEFITTMRKRYGKVFSFNIGTNRVVVCSDYEMYKEVCNKEEFQSRASIGALGDARLPDAHGALAGVMFSNAENWTQQRRFSLKSLRELGFGSRTMETQIKEELSKAINHLKQDCLDKNISLANRLNTFALNALWQIVSSEKHDYEDAAVKDLVAKVHRLLYTVSQAGVIQLFPWLKHIVPGPTGYSAVVGATNDILTVVDKAIKDHIDYNKKENYPEPRDYIDDYLVTKKNIDNDGDDASNSSFRGQRGWDNLRVNMVDFFIGGSDTTATSLDWSILWLCANPKVQKKAQQEVDRVVGKDRLPGLDDRSNMPYLEAVINEIQRISGLGYLSIPREVTKDTKLGKYDLPKGTQILVDLYSIQNDEDYWGDPKTFRPERFLDEDSKFKPDERNIPFGIGRRNCMGKSLAKNELFLFLSGFLQEFHFQFPEGQGMPDFGPCVGFLRSCPPYQVVINARH